MFRHKLGEFKKDLEFMDLNLEAKVSTVRASEIGPNIKENIYKLPWLGAIYPGSPVESPKLFKKKKISNAFPSPLPLSEKGAQAFAVAKSSILMHSEGGETLKEVPMGWCFSRWENIKLININTSCVNR